ncbi:MAG: tetraacyldisaccharide 4'-kinase, partial [Pseudomonadota bacterium]|nr:tetraacyldisaccharide 4'-kinase [Pseudomonadota bacterium]
MSALPSAFAQRLQLAWLGRGPLAQALRPLATIFGAASALQRLPYRLGWRRAVRVGVPVVVVGNLIVGG